MPTVKQNSTSSETPASVAVNNNNIKGDQTANNNKSLTGAAKEKISTIKKSTSGGVSAVLAKLAGSEAEPTDPPGPHGTSNIFKVQLRSYRCPIGICIICFAFFPPAD